MARTHESTKNLLEMVRPSKTVSGEWGVGGNMRRREMRRSMESSTKMVCNTVWPRSMSCMRGTIENASAPG